MKTIKSLIILGLCFCAVLVQAQNTAVDNITNDYLGLKNALAAGKSADAQNSAKQLFAALSDNPDAGLTTDQQKTVDSYIDKLKFDSRHISESASIDHQREHFASLSKNLYEVLKALKMNKATLYVQYCPMKKAYWLSETSSIKNPYFNDKMMSVCGSTKATLPAAK